jgi:alpha-tubulin suppressor-like RCC1 family protein
MRTSSPDNPAQHFLGKELVSLDLGAAHCLATCKDGMVYGWGRNRSGPYTLASMRVCIMFGSFNAPCALQ